MQQTIERLLDELAQVDEQLRPGPRLETGLPRRGELIEQLRTLLQAQPQAFSSSHLERLRTSWETMEQCRTELLLARQLMTGEFSQLRREQQLHDRISDSFRPEHTSWELSG